MKSFSILLGSLLLTTQVFAIVAPQKPTESKKLLVRCTSASGANKTVLADYVQTKAGKTVAYDHTDKEKGPDAVVLKTSNECIIERQVIHYTNPPMILPHPQLKCPKASTYNCMPPYSSENQQEVCNNQEKYEKECGTQFLN